MNYCTNCGNKLDAGDRFCSSCGNSLSDKTYKSEQKRKSFSYEFNSKILLGGDILNPDKLVINENGVTYVKRNKYLIGVDRVHLSYSNISSVRIDRKLIDADIIISSRGAVEIIARDFTISSAKKIEQIIMAQL